MRNNIFGSIVRTKIKLLGTKYLTAVEDYYIKAVPLALGFSLLKKFQINWIGYFLFNAFWTYALF